MISLDKYVIFESITVIMISLGIIYGQLVPILHKDFLSAHLGCQRFNFLMRKSKLLQSFANDLKYTLGDHRVAGIIEEVASIIENVHVLTKVLLLTIDVKTASVQILAEETHEEDQLEDLQPDVLLVRAFRKDSKQVAAIKEPPFKEQLQKAQQMVYAILLRGSQWLPLETGTSLWRTNIDSPGKRKGLILWRFLHGLFPEELLIVMSY